MNKLCTCMIIVLSLTGGLVHAGLFTDAQKNIEERFVRSMIDIKNSAENTAKILKATKNPQDRIRVTGGFIDQMGAAMADLTESIAYINKTFVSSFLSKGAHKKVEELIAYAKSFTDVARDVATTLKKYERPQSSEKDLEELLK